MAFTNPQPLATPPKTVLIVEDQAIVAKDIRQSLERLGYDVVGSADLVSRYRTAFAQFGLDCRSADGELCALAGLEMAHAHAG